jgi:chemotaxis protein CheC
MTNEDNAFSDFSEEEKDILQEIMNIAFGNATADLSELIDIKVILSVPDIRVIHSTALPGYLVETINHGQKNSVTGQQFWGKFTGSGVLFLPSGTERILSKFLNVSQGSDTAEKITAPPDDDSMKDGLLLEISNILIGACVGKISDLLNTVVSYTPPELLSSGFSDYNFLINHFDMEQTAIVMKTLFQFDLQDINGLLLIMTNDRSAGWLKSALHKFMEEYEG